jgi:uncharacterized membrane protein
VRAIARLEISAAEERTRFSRFCDRVTQLAGTTGSIALHAAWLAVWILANVLGPRPFDPFPFNTLTSLISLEAIFLALFVLASQNRLTRDADKRAHLDLQINMLAEQEMTFVLRMLQAICAKTGVRLAPDEADAVETLVADTDIANVAKRVDEGIPPTPVAK